MTDMYCIFQIKRAGNLGYIGCISIHVVPLSGLGRPAMSPAIVGNHPKSTLEEKHHLCIPVVARQWPTMMEKNWLTRSPVLVINFRSVLYCNFAHRLNFN